MKRLILVLLFCISTFHVNAQLKLSVYSEVSIITAGPGDKLFEAFGHTAIRIKDPMLRLDLVYNYGMFDFNAPNFYANFTKGKLLYKLGRYPFKFFFDSYKQDKRWVKQQVLNLNQTQRQEFFEYLEKNAMPENASYFYDPFFNNCATKPRDIVKNILQEKVTFNDSVVGKSQTLRTLMNKEIPWNTWGSFGINLALGNKLDQVIKAKQFMYLPDYVYSIFKRSTILIDGKQKPLVLKERELLKFPEIEQKIQSSSPFLIFLIMSIIGLNLTYRDYKNKKRTKLLDFVFLFITGLIGVLLVFLWLFTDHSNTLNNFNVLWAFAPNIIIAFFVLKSNNPKWLSHYFKLLIILLALIPFLWIFKVQLFPLAIIPLLVFLAFRYLYLVKVIK
ncbi:MAG: DUF4105 domain-containing protein [Flavobacteriaceae bacterium]|nr:DUF4105 domain-containing protein [Flavobacteriaceae bacterium]